MSTPILRVPVTIHKEKDEGIFVAELHRLAEKKKVSFSNVELISDGRHTVYLRMLPEHLTTDINDVISWAAHNTESVMEDVETIE